MDVIAGKNIGGHGCLVRTGWGAGESEYQNAILNASCIGQTLEDVVNWILETKEMS